MNAITRIHHEAMAISDEAFAARREGKTALSVSRFQRAFAKEARAAELTLALDGCELSKSVLCRSAGWLAVHGGELDEAEKFAKLGLGTNPPPEIKSELRKLLAEIAKRRRGGAKTASKRKRRASKPKTSAGHPGAATAGRRARGKAAVAKAAVSKAGRARD